MEGGLKRSQPVTEATNRRGAPGIHLTWQKGRVIAYPFCRHANEADMQGHMVTIEPHYLKPTLISLKDDPRFNEAWVHARIKEDTSILGLGELDVLATEKVHPKAGRLDMLLRDPETLKRYEVEIQLGAVDESHIIRTIEYWDIERKRYPNSEHVAVIVAERITGRFLNVISLFNGAIPLIAVQLNAYEVGAHVILTATRVMDAIALASEDEDEAAGAPADRAYWEKRATKETVGIVDGCLALWREISPSCELKYNRQYIGLREADSLAVFAFFRPRKQHHALVDVRVGDREGWGSQLAEAGFEVMTSQGESKVRLRITRDELKSQRNLLLDLFRDSYAEVHG